MSKVIDRKIEKEISTGLKLNRAINQPLNTYVLPRFDKNDKGEYIFVGNCTITSISEFNKYMRTYREIANSLRKTYRPVIAKIYKNALNSLVADNSKFRITDNDFSLVSKLSEKPFTLNSLQDNSSSAYKQTLNFVTKAAYKSKRLKPSNKINELVRSNDKDFEYSQLYVLPVMTENGVVINQKKQNKTAIEAQFETVSKNDAVAIKNYLIEATNGLDEDSATQIKNQIEKVFKESLNIGESIRAGLNNNLSSRLEKLTSEFADLIGVDLSNYNKGTNKITRKAVSETPAEVENNQEPVAEEPVPKTTPNRNSFEANEILMNGTYKTAPSIEDGRIVTKLSPEGMKFTVTFKNNKLFVSNEQSADESVFGK